MNPESVGSVLETLKELAVEFGGGFLAFWTHHVFHKAWHQSEKLKKLRGGRRGGE